MADTATQQLPTADEFFGSSAQQDNEQNGSLPTADQFFAQPKPSATQLTLNAIKAPPQYDANGGYTPNPAVQEFLKGTSVGRIMNAFNNGAQEQAQGELGLSKDTVDGLRKAGIYNDYANGEFNLGKALTEIIATPAAMTADAFFKTAGAAISGTSEAIQQGLREVGLPGIAGGVGELTDYAMNSPILGEAHPLPLPVAKAKSAGVLEPEAVFTGVKEPTPEQSVAMHDAAVQVTPEEPIKESEQTLPDIHQAARNIDPKTFAQYDKLSATQDDLRNQLQQMRDTRAQQFAGNEKQLPQVQDEISTLQANADAIIGGKNETDLSPKNLSKVQDIRSQIDDLKGLQDHLSGTDTPEMAALRQKIQDTNYAMRDLAPNVSAAYRKAQEGIGSESAVSPQEQPQTAKLTEPAQQNTDIEQQKKFIIADQAQKLIAAGRPSEEANAAAQLVAEHYAARAERFGGKLGNAEEMYNRDMATVKAGRKSVVREKELAQNQDGFDLDNSSNLESSSGLSGKPYSQTAPTVKPGFQEPSSHISDFKPPESVFTTRPTEPSTLQGGVSSSISRLYHKTDDIQEVRELAKKAEPDLHTFLKSLVESTDNASLYGVRLKDENGINQKLQERRPINQIGDFLGGRIIANTPEAVNELVTKIEQNAHVIAKDDFLNNEGPSDGYRAIYLQVMGKDGFSAEIQIQPKELTDVLPEGHALYKQWKRQVSAGNLEKALQTKQEVKKLYDNAWDKWTSRNAQELNQGARGKIRLATNDAKAAITLMKSANASTFIHEAGHHWLDELMHDATDEHAPDDLIQDSKTVREWLGVKDGEEIPTKAHEKFARGFERYLMEGTAPSKQLAGVFAKFKQWLTKIYQTVDKLRSPISDDIRDVFDRLLAKNPEKTVIALEHDAGKMMADIHETDAEHTAPEHAAEVADNINDERQRLKGQNNVTNTENTAGDAGNAEPETANSTAEPAASETGTSQQPSPISAGGNKAAPESGQLRTAEQPIPEQRRTDPRSGSREVLGNPKSDLVDKAGNIRLDNLNAPESVNEVIRQIAAENHDFTEARGVVSDDQVMRLADSLGIKASEVQLKRIASIMGPGQLASKIMAARKLLIQSATNLRDLMAKAATGSDEDVMAYAEAKQRHIMIQSQISGITGEAGRALRAFRNIEGSKEAQSIGDFLKQATGKDLFQLKEEAKLGVALDTPEKVSKFIEDSKKPSFGDMLLEYWVNGLISGPATHTTYAIGNTLLAMWKAIPETAVASLLGKIRGDNAIKLGEVGAQLKGAVEGLPKAVSAAAKAAKTGVTTLLPGEEAAAQQFGGKGIPEQIGNEDVSWTQAGADAFGAIKGLRDAFVASGNLAQTGAIPDFALGGLKIPVGSIIRAPARAIAAIHSFFRTVNYSMDKAAIAYRTASDEGLDGTDFDARVVDIVQNPSEEIMAQARGTATNLTLMGEGGEFTKTIGRLTNISVNLPVLGQTKLLKFIDPFVHIGSNVIDQSILQRTPVGLLSAQIRADLSGANGAVARDFAASRMIVGSALAITIGGLASEGLISGSGPSDPRESSAWRMLGGNQPHSVKIGDIWYDVHRLGPLGMLMGISADLYDVAHTAEQGEFLKASTSFVHAITQNILDESFMRGPSDLIKALTDSDRYGDAYIRNFISSFVPFSVGLSQEARAIDPYSRQARTLVDAIKAKIPYVSESLFPRRDIWGQPIANKDVLGAAGFSAIYESRISKDPTNQRLLALGVYPSQPERKIRGVQLTDQQYDDFCKIAGKTAKMRLDSIVPNSGFSNLPESAQIDIIKNTIKTARETASSIVMMQNPEIIQKATEQKLAILQGKK
jgi:hypothetical protein